MDSFSDQFEKRNWAEVSAKINSINSKNIERALEGAGEGGMDDLAALLPPLANKEYLEDMAQLANRLTMQRFGKAIRLFAPIYLSNECNNVCDYCGFSMGNDIARKTLSPAEILREIGILKKLQFDHVLLVTG